MKLPLILVASLLIASLNAAPSLDSDLIEALQGGKAESLTVIASFARPPATLSTTNYQALRLARENWTRKSQSGILKRLREKALVFDSVLKVESLWINNSAIISASPSIIREILDQGEILSLSLDRAVRLEEPIKDRTSGLSQTDHLTYGLEMIEARRVWEDFGVSGAGVTVGVLDTGWSDHLEFRNRVAISRDFASSYAQNVPNDGHGHGSHVMGTIGGGKLSGQSIGVAPRVRFVVAKIFDDQGSATTAGILRAMQWIADPDGDPSTPDHPAVINNSWGSPLGGVVDEARWEAIQTWRDLQIYPVFAAGNSGPSQGTIVAPGAYPHALAVGAVDENDKITWFSSRGHVTWDGVKTLKPDISAPGAWIYSVDHRGGYIQLSGTSMAAPHVAGTVALLREARSDLSVDEIDEILFNSSKDLGVQGPDAVYGRGRLNAFEAVKLARSGGKIQVQIKNARQKVFITVDPGLRVIQPDDDGLAEFLLPEGSYELEFSSFWNQTEKRELTLKAGQVLPLKISMRPAKLIQAKFQVVSPSGKPLATSFSFSEIPLEGGSSASGSFEVRLPRGEYDLQVKSRGYRSKLLAFRLSDDDSLIKIKLEPLPPLLLVDGDQQDDYEVFYREGLEGLQVDYDPALFDHLPNLEEALGYHTILWFTGDARRRILDESSRLWIRSFLQEGGSVILTGQNIGSTLRSTRFFSEVLGARYLYDSSPVRQIKGRGLSFQLDGDASANNQVSPDVIEVADDSPQVLFRYSGGGPAALVNRYASGKVIYLSFGFEGIDGAMTRKKVMQTLLSALQPDLVSLLEQIEATYPSRPLLHRYLMGRLSLSLDNRDQILEILRGKKDKSPFRGLLQRLRLQH